MSGRVSSYLSHINGLQDVADRLQVVQFENRDALEVIARYDSPGTLFYCDPPYFGLGGYANNIDAWNHIQLAQALHGIQGRAAISGYESEFYSNLYGDWRKVVGPLKFKSANVQQHKKQTREIVWMNYDELGRKL
jgi:DNA adenine methylase